VFTAEPIWRLWRREDFYTCQESNTDSYTAQLIAFSEQ
jgi:hypothetical protein